MLNLCKVAGLFHFLATGGLFEIEEERAIGAISFAVVDAFGGIFPIEGGVRCHEGYAEGFAGYHFGNDDEESHGEPGQAEDAGGGNQEYLDDTHGVGDGVIGGDIASEQ